MNDTTSTPNFGLLQTFHAKEDEPPTTITSCAQGRIVIKPGRAGTQPTVGDSDILATEVAETYYAGGTAAVAARWAALSRDDIKLACWWYYHSTRTPRTWEDWYRTNHDAIEADRWGDVSMPAATGRRLVD